MRFPLDRLLLVTMPQSEYLTASGPDEEKLFDHLTSSMRYNLRLSPVTDHMLQRGLKFEVSAKTLARTSKRQT